ncbi:N-acetylmuramoyl-L-alanine amidase [uncultured Clostridium sp.]|uniref:N-acetylmuramoyl-L-alanine amidase n=1 Tax=uncultured Clostridium sp. TaxID=59620 RepID=UPI0032172354
MKIGDSAGHTTSCPGANLYVNEVIEVRRILPIVNELLKPYHTIIDCQPPESYNYPQEINFRVQKSDNSGCDLYFSIHLNSSSKTDAPIGSEVLIYMGTPLTTKIGNQICNNLASLGFKNRGLKDGIGFAEVSSIKCPSMIIEVFFVSSKADCDLYKKLGVEKIARAIANGIDSRVNLDGGYMPTQPTPPPVQNPSPSKSKVDVFYKFDNLPWVKNLEDDAGLRGVNARNLYVYPSKGEVLFRVSGVNRDYYPWVQNYKVSNGNYDFAGDGIPIDRVQMKLRGLDGYSIRYRVTLTNGVTLPWVVNDTDFAGIRGQSISRVQIDIVSR